MSSQKVESQQINGQLDPVAKQEQKIQLNHESICRGDKNLSQEDIRDHLLVSKEQQKSQNPKIGRPAKTDQEEEFKKCYLQNKQKFELQCQLLVYIHQNYFDQIIDNPINTRVNKQYMDRLFVANNCEGIYRTLLRLNESYFKNSSYYPEEKLRYTSLIDVAYMCGAVKREHGERVSAMGLLLVVFFYLYNEKLVNKNFYDYFVRNVQKFREGMVFGPGGKSAPKLQKLDKLIICLALTLADLEKILIEEEVIYSEEEYSQSEQDIQDREEVKIVYQSRGNCQQQFPDGVRPRKRIHEDR